MHSIPDTEFIKTPTYKVLTLTRKSQPTTRFVDVGSAFMDARELAKRRVNALRTSRMRKWKILRKRFNFVKEDRRMLKRMSRISAEYKHWLDFRTTPR
jgi:hypothetical protein